MPSMVEEMLAERHPDKIAIERFYEAQRDEELDK
jgi:hypothetical protein